MLPAASSQTAAKSRNSSWRPCRKAASQMRPSGSVSALRPPIMAARCRTLALLRPRCDRPANCCAADQRDELAPSHSIISFASKTSWTSENLSSFRLDSSLLNDGPPLFDLAFLQGAERLWALLFAGENLLSEIDKSLTNCGLTQGTKARRIEPLNDGL